MTVTMTMIAWRRVSSRSLMSFSLCGRRATDDPESGDSALRHSQQPCAELDPALDGSTCAAPSRRGGAPQRAQRTTISLIRGMSASMYCFLYASSLMILRRNRIHHDLLPGGACAAIASRGCLLGEVQRVFRRHKSLARGSMRT